MEGKKALADTATSTKRILKSLGFFGLPILNKMRSAILLALASLATTAATAATTEKVTVSGYCLSL